jgi:hypothetical protein
MAAVYQNIPKDIPVIGTHVWPAQAALHAGMKYVVNAIPDNWPMALHLAEGAVHTIQCRNAYMGYRVLNGMNKNRVCKPMPNNDLIYTGHYVDDEIVKNIKSDSKKRMKRKKDKKPMRFLLTIGGAGAQKEIFAAVIRKLLPEIKAGRAALFINVGDHAAVWRDLLAEIPQMKPVLHEHFDDFKETQRFCSEVYEREVSGIHVFCHSDIFAAVYSTNLLMRCSDILITKPSELAFYPIPKLMIKRVGGHEAWGAIRAAEIGDGTYECSTPAETAAMIDMIQHGRDIIEKMCGYILTAKKAGVYNGAYRAVELAVGKNK